jgi:hypothetical protein
MCHMEKLSKDWLTQGLIDFEYKKYLLMAYLQTVKNSFGKVELYPFLADLVFHYRNLQALKENKALIREMIEDDVVMGELESIINFALPQIKDSLQEGSIIYEYVESQCEISPVGVTPLYAKEGYLFVTQPPEKETNIYRYQMSIFEGSQEQLRSLNTEFIERVEKNPSNTYERLKLELIRKFKDLPNPAAYLILARMKFPFTETLMPVAKRLFVKHISQPA